HYAVRRPLPMTVWRDLGPVEVAAFAERATGVPAVDLMVNPVRAYPLGALAAHVVGYVNRDRPASDADVLEQYYYYQPDLVGKQGVERAWDTWLRGEPGGRTIRVSPGGTTAEVVAEKPPARGHTVVLTLDARIQRLAEEALASAPVGERPLRGAVVVMDVSNGEVLALVSWPTFDPNVFHTGGAGRVEALFQDVGRPLFNRAIGGLYAPGSTFKPVTLLAALESGRGRLQEVSHCSGALMVGNRSFGCWRREGHGAVDGLTAMRWSCDVWFYERGLATGVEQLERVARWFGLGEPTGVDVGIEPAGLVPTPAWKRRQHGERWWDGDTAQLAIGQSFLLATPLQMTVMAAALANGGTVWRPFVVKRVISPSGEVVHETRPQARGRVPANAANFEWVRRSLWDAVRLADGTAHRASVPGLSVAGKTGTAEFDLYEGGQRRRINRGWFIGFAPYEQPRYAVTVLLEEAVSGGHTAAPVAGKIFAGLFGRTYAAVASGGGD
ncbi:MAG: penicillin-binding protein 2, partial [Verrucomicrobiae bacterium]|nr:penicillin-binding protein 2 [Verrucomicrobiae bacterium]